MKKATNILGQGLVVSEVSLTRVEYNNAMEYLNTFNEVQKGFVLIQPEDGDNYWVFVEENELLSVLIDEVGCGFNAKTLYDWVIDNEMDEDFIEEAGYLSITEMGEHLIEMARNGFDYKELSAGYWVAQNLF